MPFDYNKTKHAHSGDSFWTSYSDLFLGLSTIFLLLYVTASLRSGTDAIKTQVDNQKLTMKVEELQSQLKMYEQVKADYLEKSASKDEQQEYKELMDKLTLLKEDSKSDGERLARESLENERKAEALNKYQQMIRNVINANKLAKTKLIARNGIINDQDTEIDEQQKDISTLKADVSQKKAQIEAGEEKIEQAKEAMEKKQKELLAAYRHNKMTKKQYEAKLQQAQRASDQRINGLQAANQTYSNQLHQLSNELKGTQVALEQKDQEAQAARGAADAARNDAQAARGEAQAAHNEAEGMRGQIAGIKAGYAAQAARDKAAFDAEMRKSKMDADERARREGQFRAAAAAKEREMQGKIAGLSGALKSTEGELAKAKEEMDARREIAKEIKKGFAAAGVKADIDMQTGEVVLDFGDAYFESDSANLKPQMKDVIERAMPVYSKSLFGNKKVADKISNVEIVGFASPTYKGRFVDPRSRNAEDKAALKYNMDLSYRRANSIFSYLVSNKNNEFDHQQDLLALMKVSGRSFLEVMKVQGRSPTSAAEFCKVNDCKKAQKVIVRFSMDGKK
jgi:outer membrane protein OmpA-like peptidoglycan-associated protein